MNASKIKIGDPIDSWCTACKGDHPHSVATLKTDGTLNKVLCSACSAEHVYRRPKSEAAEGKKPAGSRKRKADPGSVSDAEASKAKPYAMDGIFAVGDVIEHAKFGFGRVVTVKPGGKIEVAFADGNRVLVCRDQGMLGTRRSSRAVAAARVVEAEPADDDAPVADDAETETEGDDAAADDEEE